MDRISTVLGRLQADPRENKLPKWAQEHLALARLVAAEAHRLAMEAVLATDPEGSTALLDNVNGTPVGLGSHAKVIFMLGDVKIDGQVKLDRQRGPYLELTTPDGTLAVTPQSTNVMRVTVFPR